MPRGGRQPNAGRKSARDERLVFEVINKAWDRVAKNLNQNRTSDKEKDMIALEIVKRTAPKNLDIVSKGEEIKPVLVRIIGKDDKQ